MNKPVSIFLTFIFILCLAPYASAQSPQKPLHPVRAKAAPKIDGILDDPVWKYAPFEIGFKTWYPDYEKPMTEKTKVWYAYDSENIYFAFRCFDSRPELIKTSVTARDKIDSDDWVCINLDTFNDQQAIYAFYVNPVGIQMDSRASSADEDISVDIVWYSAGHIDDMGYTIEMKIPFKSIRYSQKDPMDMGVIFERRISRKSEQGTYPPLDPRQGPNFLTQTRPLIYKDIKKYRLIEILPAFTHAKNSAHENGRMVSEGGKSNGSITAKYGITSRLVADGTYNPDFSQVEADAGQVDFNQRYALYYPEKRPFFLEGREHFDFGGSSGGDPLGAVVHTRMIENPEIGVKLTGKISKNNTLAAIYARDVLPDYKNEGEYADFSIMRYKRALNQDSFIGGFYTERSIDTGNNRVYGADGQIRITPSTMVGFHGFLSNDKNGSSENDGHAVGLNYYYSTRDWLINLRAHDLSEGFNTRTGYVTRTGLTRLRGGFMKMYYPKSSFFKRIDPLFNTMHIRDKESRRWEGYNAFYLTFIMPRSASIRTGYINSDEIYLSKRFDTSRFSLSGAIQVTKQFYYNMTYQFSKKIRYISLPYQGEGNDASVSFLYQPSDKLQASLNIMYSDFTRESNRHNEYDYTIVYSKNTFQLNRYLFFRAIIEYNSFREDLTTDYLASFTYIPGTVIHLGYGSYYEKIRWDGGKYIDSDRYLESRKGFFFKTSYLWRL